MGAIKMKKSKRECICSLCGNIVNGNVDPTRELVCWRCTDNLVEKIRTEEELLKTSFRDTKDYEFKLRSFKEKGKAENQNVLLKKARKKMGWSQQRLAVALGISQSLVTQMELGTRPLTPTSLALLELINFPVFDKQLIIQQLQESRKKPISTYAPPQFCAKNPIDSKQVTDAQNEGQ